MVHKRCCVPNCSNVKLYPKRNSKQYLVPPPQRTFRMFKFPFKGDPQRARKWAEAIGKPDMEMKSSTFICSDHFRTEDYLPVDDTGSLMDFSVGRHCLGSWAIPSLFLSIPAVSVEQEDKCEADKDRGSGDGADFFGEREEEGELCLICSLNCNQSVGLRSPLKFNGDSGTGLSSVVLNDQLWSTFILRNVLKLSQGDYQRLLGRVGGSVHPAKWFVVCRLCERILVQILDVYEALKKLERQMESLSVKLRNKLQESLLKEKESNECNDNTVEGEEDTILNVRKEIRKCLQETPTPPPIKQPKQEPEEEYQRMIISDFDDSWLPGSPSSPPRLPVKEEDPAPNPGSSAKSLKKKKRPRPTAKMYQMIRKLKITKTKCTQPQPPKPRPPRIRNRKGRTSSSAVCEFCGIDAIFPVDLKRHMQMHKLYDNSFDTSISKTHLFCNLCSPYTFFPNRQSLGAHKRKEHAEQLNLPVLKCSECRETFLSKLGLGNHQLKKHLIKFQDKILQCEKCKFHTLAPSELKRHIFNTHTTTTPLICQHCSSTYKNPSTLYRHMKIYHPEFDVTRRRSTAVTSVDGTPAPRGPHSIKAVSGDKEFPCKNCDAVFYNKLQLKLHLENSHKDLFIYQCDMCDKSYLRASSLQTHRKINHLESGKKSKCGYCGKVVNHKIYLWTHMKYCQKKPVDVEGPAINAVEVEVDANAGNEDT